MQSSQTSKLIQRRIAPRRIELTVETIRQRFKDAGKPAPHPRKAQAILEALPYGATATGDSELEVLDLCITNFENGAVKRLLQLRRDMTGQSQTPGRRGARKLGPSGKKKREGK